MVGQAPDGIKLTWNIINENVGCCIILDQFGYSNFAVYTKTLKE